MAQTFSFHGSALALGGVITGPQYDAVPAQAASALTPAGGIGTARVDMFKYGALDWLSFESAECTVQGYKTGEGNQTKYHTTALATIERLNVFNVVTADLIVSKLTSEHSTTNGHSIEFAGSRFVNLHIKGRLVEATGHDDLFKLQKLSALSSSSVSTQGVSTIPYGQIAEDPKVFTTIFPRSIDVPGFGIIHLGKLVNTGQSGSLTMLRIELKDIGPSKVHGTIEVANTVGNGVIYD